MKNIVIIGAGDLGKELVWLIEDINKVRPTYLILGFLDDDLSKDTYSFCDTIISYLNFLMFIKDIRILVSILSK